MIVIIVYYAGDDCKLLNFNSKKENFSLDKSNYNNKTMTNTCSGNDCSDNRSLLERIKNYSNGCQGYPNFNKPVYLPPKLYDVEVASGYNPFVTFSRVNYRPIQQYSPQDKDFPDVINPKGKKQPVQYLPDDAHSNIVMSHGYLQRDGLRDLFKDSDRVTVAKDIQPANEPNCDGQYDRISDFKPKKVHFDKKLKEYDIKEGFQPMNRQQLRRRTQTTCNVCGAQHSEEICPQCGMSCANSKSDTIQLQRLQTLPEWKNQNLKNALRVQGTEHLQKNSEYDEEDRGGYRLDGVTFIEDNTDAFRYQMKDNYTPYADGGLGANPKDCGKIINRTNPPMFYREGKLQESEYPPEHEIDEFVGTNNFVFNRLDPQLIRDDPTTMDAGRIEEMPKRNQWTKKMSRYEAPSHTTPIDNIDGNPAIDQYNTGYKAMKDCAGNIFYQTEEAVYQYPNFSKSDVDMNLYLNPMYGVMPEQRRVLTVPEARAVAHSQWDSDSLNTRSEYIEGYLDKLAARRIQLKQAPLSGARGMRGFA